MEADWYWLGAVDDSENTRNLAVGGCAAPLSAWAALIPDWVTTLEAHGLRWFHAKEFWSNHGKPGFRVEDPSQRDVCYRALVSLICERHIARFCYTIPAHQRQQDAAPARPRRSAPRTFTEVRGQRTEAILDDDYCKGLAWVLNHAASRLSAGPRRTRLHVTVAEQPRKNGFIPIVHRIVREVAPHGRRLAPSIATGASYKHVVPLQIADLIAWETAKDTARAPGSGPWPSFLRLRIWPGRFKTGDPPRFSDGWLRG